MAPLNQMVMQPSPLGENFLSASDIAGPASYTTGGVAISATAWALLSSIKFILGATAQSATYRAEGRSINGPGSTSIKVVWFVVATGAEVANATNLSAETVRLGAVGN